MQKKKLPIGVFDSGVGGLSVLKHAIRELPEENFIYYGDTKNAPYGERSEEEIKELSLACGEFLYKKGVKAIVMACNTATSIAVKQMREQYQIPVISIEPAVKPAYLARETGKVLVMATPATIAQSRYHLLVEKIGCEDVLINLPCPGLADLLEEGDFSGKKVEDYLREKFSSLKGETIDGIVMGCTHYSFIADKIQQIARDYVCGKTEIFDGMYGMVAQLKRVLEQEGLQNHEKNQTVTLYASKEESVALFKKILA